MITNQNTELGERESGLLIRLKTAERALDKVGIISRWANIVGLVAFILMICLTFADVFLRYIFNQPITGAKEITSMMLVLLVSFGIAYTQFLKGHIAVDIVTNYVPTKVRLIMNTITTFVGIGLFSIIVWRSAVQFLFFYEHNTINTYSIKIPSAPFAAIIVIGCSLLLLILIRDLFHNIAECIIIRINTYQWLLIFGIVIALVLLGLLWMQPNLWEMSRPLVGLIGVICSLIFLFSGMPISFALILSSFLFISHIRGSYTAMDLIGREIFTTFSNYLWVVLAFFVVMGFICLYARFGEDLYRAAHKWIGGVHGGLGIATIAACTAMGAIVGDTLSVVSTMGTVALPEMKKYKYDTGLATGAIASGATLGSMVPPSMGFIMYGILTQQSIGKLFIAGIVPAIFLTCAFALTIYIRCRRNPDMGPPSDKSTWANKLVSLKAGGPVALLFLLVIGGIYAGAFTPSEGGGIGATGAIIIALIMRRFTLKTFFEALLGAGKIIAMVFLILFGATTFTRFIAWCNIVTMVQQFMLGLALPSFLIALIIFFIFGVLGFIIDIMPIFLIGVPIFHPILVNLGYDPVWIALMIVAIIQLGLITPPMATNLFAIKGIAKDIPMGTIYKGVWPFVLATGSVVIILFLFPGIVTWLPNLMYPS